MIAKSTKFTAQEANTKVQHVPYSGIMTPKQLSTKEGNTVLHYIKHMYYYLPLSEYPNCLHKTRPSA